MKWRPGAQRRAGRPGRRRIRNEIREVIHAIERDGWQFRSQKGSHRQYVHPLKPGRVTVAGKPGDDMHPDTLSSIFRQAQMQKSRSS